MKKRKMMLCCCSICALCFRLRRTAFSVLVSLILVSFQILMPMAHDNNQNKSDCTADSKCSEDELLVIREARALCSVLAKIAKLLDEGEENTKQIAEKSDIHVEIDIRKPIKFDEEKLCKMQDELECLALGQRREKGRIIENLDEFLVRSHVKYKELKKEGKNLRMNSNDPTQFKRHIDDIDKNVHSLLKRRGLHRTMSAVVRSGFTLADVANDGEMQSGEPLSPLPNFFNVQLSTKHWGDEEYGIDLSLTGQIGTIPILAIYSSANGNAVTGKKIHDVYPASPVTPNEMSNIVRALHQPGLIYEAQINGNIHMPGNGETSVFAGLGQTRLMSRSATIGLDQQTRPVQLEDNGPGLSAYRSEFGIEYKLYAQEMVLVHHDKSLLSPVFNIAAGCRWDERLRAWPGPSHSERGTPRRIFARLGFDLRQVLWQRKGEDKGKFNSVGIRIVAEREWGGFVPIANRLFVEADFNLSKMLMGNPTGD